MRKWKKKQPFACKESIFTAWGTRQPHVWLTINVSSFDYGTARSGDYRDQGAENTRKKAQEKKVKGPEII
jgi:hypothetical protein